MAEKIKWLNPQSGHQQGQGLEVVDVENQGRVCEGHFEAYRELKGGRKMGTMRALNEKGDTNISWDSENPTEVETAKGVFAMYKEKGYAPFRIISRGRKGSQIKEFDPLAEEILFVPPIAGG